MEKNRAYDSELDEVMQNTVTGEEVEAPHEGAEPGDPKGNPHDYVDKEKSKDGVPFDHPNSEHLAKEDDKVYQTSAKDPKILPKEQEPGAAGSEVSTLAGVVEHEGHSVGIHKDENGFVVRGRGTTAYFKSEPITNQEHAEEHAKEFLKSHAKLTEREIVARTTNLSDVVHMDWSGKSPKEKKAMWESLTGGAKHKISACMNKVDGHVDDPGAFCKSLGDEVGYKPE